MIAASVDLKVMSQSKRLNKTSVILVVGISFLIGFAICAAQAYDNFLSLGYLQAAFHQNAEIEVDKVPESKRALVSAVFLASNEPKRSIDLLSIDTKQSASSSGYRQPVLKAMAFLRLGKLGMAGESFQKAGFTNYLDTLISKGENYPDVPQIISVTLAVAQSSAAQGDIAQAKRYVEYVLKASKANSIKAHALHVQSIALAYENSYIEAYKALRYSMDIEPPTEIDDERFETLYGISKSLVKENGCQVNQWRGIERIGALTYIYLSNESNSTDICRQKLIRFIDRWTNASERGYIRLQLAKSALDLGELQSADALLSLAESDGVPRIWRRALKFDYSSKSSTSVTEVPTYPLPGSLEWEGYELDPLQLELGLPIDLVLLPSRSETDNRIVEIRQVFNLAPNPGFEFEYTCPETACILKGYEKDIYHQELPKQGYVVQQLIRPFSPIRPVERFESSVLTLNNREVAVGPTLKPSLGLESFTRYIKPNSECLQGGWIASQGGNGFLGRLWRSGNNSHEYSFVVGQYNKMHWEYLSEWIKTPLAMNLSSVWILNFDTYGDVSFDQMLFACI